MEYYILFTTDVFIIYYIIYGLVFQKSSTSNVLNLHYFYINFLGKICLQEKSSSAV